MCNVSRDLSSSEDILTAGTNCVRLVAHLAAPAVSTWWFNTRLTKRR